MLDANFSLFAAARRLFAVMSLISYYTFFSLPVFYFIDFFVVIPRQTIWHPFFCCETNPYLGLPCTPAFTMLALGMPEDWQPPPDLSAIHLQTASHGSLSSTVNAFGPRSSIQIQPSAR